MSPDVPAFQVRVFTSDFKFWIGFWMNINSLVVDIPTEILLTIILLMFMVGLWIES